MIIAFILGIGRRLTSGGEGSQLPAKEELQNDAEAPAE